VGGRTHKPTAPGEGKTVGDLIDRYLEVEIPKRGRSSERVPTYLNWWKAEIGDVPLTAITARQLAECRDKLLRSPSGKNFKRRPTNGLMGPATVAWYMSALSVAFSVAMKEWEWLDSNPMFKVKKPSLPKRRVRFLHQDEFPRLLAACKASAFPGLYPIVAMTLSTACRKAEIVTLRWCDVDIKREVIYLEETKNGERRAVPLKYEALAVVRELASKRTKKARSTDYLFARADGLKPQVFDKHWYRALDKAQIPNFRFHDLRHTAASYLTMNGSPLNEVAEILGHKDINMVMRYAHLSPQHSAKVIEKMNKALFGKRSK